MFIIDYIDTFNLGLDKNLNNDRITRLTLIDKEHMNPSRKDIVTFEFIWAFIFFLIALYPVIYSAEIRIWSLIISTFFILIALISPLLLSSFYIYWVKFGEFIGGIISKVILFILFFGIFTPVALILKLMGKDLLNKQLNTNILSYWKVREEQPGTLKNQF